MIETMTPDELNAAVLAAPMPPNDAEAETIRDYLVALLAQLWNEGEGFSGKRPLGNSGWESVAHAALVHAHLLEGTFDQHGYLDEYDDDQADHLILDAIRSLGADATELAHARFLSRAGAGINGMAVEDGVEIALQRTQEHLGVSYEVLEQAAREAQL